MTQSNDKIKGPVRTSKHTPIYVLDADGSFLFPVYDRTERDEIIHKHNGYNVAVKALTAISECRVRRPNSVAEQALRDLGELDGGENQGLENTGEGPDGQEVQSAGRSQGSAELSDTCGGETDCGNITSGGGDSVCGHDDCDDPVADDDIDTCCWSGGCDRPLGTDPMYCPLHEKMQHVSQEAAERDPFSPAYIENPPFPSKEADDPQEADDARN